MKRPTAPAILTGLIVGNSAAAAISVGLGPPLTKWADFCWIGATAIWSLNWLQVIRQRDREKDRAALAEQAGLMWKERAQGRWN